MVNFSELLTILFIYLILIYCLFFILAENGCKKENLNKLAFSRIRDRNPINLLLLEKKVSWPLRKASLWYSMFHDVAGRTDAGEKQPASAYHRHWLPETHNTDWLTASYHKEEEKNLQNKPRFVLLSWLC